MRICRTWRACELLGIFESGRKETRARKVAKDGTEQPGWDEWLVGGRMATIGIP
jgi:hypothetical protein